LGGYRVSSQRKSTKLKFYAGVRNSNVDKTVADDEEPVQLCNYTDVYYNDRITGDLEFMQGSATQSEIEKFQLKRGQVIITKDSEGWDDIGIPALVTEDMPDVLCGYHLSVFEPGPDLDGAFLAWLCRSEPLNNQFKLGANGVTRYGLGQYPMKNALVALPPKETQRQIARFLDEKTAQIDGLIEKKRALLDRLAEKRQALITRAVTKGLDPAAPMKSSGINWLGDIPAHWDVQRLDRLTQARRPIRYGIVLPGPHIEDGVPIIKGGDVRPNRLNRDTLSRTTPEIDAAHSRSRLRAGDIVYSIRGSFGDVELIPDELDGINLTQDAARISPIEEVDREWLLLTLKSDAVLLQMAAGAIGATIKGINIRDLRRAILPLPSRGEQEKIRAWLAERLGELDNQNSLVERSIGLLVEYRSALITAAVTSRVQPDRVLGAPSLEEA
jgi:type I restriction enzyme S subunit